MCARSSQIYLSNAFFLLPILWQKSSDQDQDQLDSDCWDTVWERHQSWSWKSYFLFGTEVNISCHFGSALWGHIALGEWVWVSFIQRKDSNIYKIMCSLILKMPWPLGNFQLYAKPCFWRVWDPKRNLVSGWDEHNGIRRKRILCPLRWCNWWALLFVSCTIHPPPTFDWSECFWPFWKHL